MVYVNKKRCEFVVVVVAVVGVVTVVEEYLSSNYNFDFAILFRPHIDYFISANFMIIFRNLSIRRSQIVCFSLQLRKKYIRVKRSTLS